MHLASVLIIDIILRYLFHMDLRSIYKTNHIDDMKTHGIYEEGNPLQMFALSACQGTHFSSHCSDIYI